MVLAHGIDKKVGICDIECFRELFDVGCYDPDTREWTEFEVSQYKDELYAFVKWYKSKPYDFLVTFNGVGYDQQVLQWIVDNYEDWYDLDGLEICAKISAYSTKVIEDSRYQIPHKYRETDFCIPALDVFKIHHFDNEARRTSLKFCEFMMNMDVEEMPLHHLSTGLTPSQIEEIRSYRRHDVLATYGVLLITLGRVSDVEKLNGGHSLEELYFYKGKNKIQDRYDVWKETGIWCMNMSDVTIGEEWNKSDYKHAENIKPKDERGLLYPKKPRYPFGDRFKKYFPTTVSFQTPSVTKFVNAFGNQTIKAEKQEFPVIVGETRYNLAKGGIHSNEKHRRIKVPEGYIYNQIDVGGQYPNAIKKLRITPPHLNENTLLSQFEEKIEKRTKYKKIAFDLIDEGKKDEARPFMSIQEMMKLCNNGGYFGKLGQKGSFLQYPEGLLKCCISNELEILMLIEELELKGFKVVSGNTDGCDVIYPETKEKELLEICEWWENKVGNIKLGKLEHTHFTEVWQESVNHYIAKKKKGGVKKKGRFQTEFELHKSKSARIIPLALEAYFIEGKDVAEFITNHKKIFDFCIAKKSFGNMYYEEEWVDDEGKTHTKKHNKLVRYFISKKGTVLWKRGFDQYGDVMNNQCEAPKQLGQPKVTYFNRYWKSDDYDIDYDKYILRALTMIDKIEKTKKVEPFIQKVNGVNQLTLF